MDKWDRGLGVKQLANVLTPDVNRPLGRNVRNPTSSFAKWGVFILYFINNLVKI